MLAIKGYFQFKVDQVHLVRFNDHFLLWQGVAEDEEEAKPRTEAGKIGVIRAAVNTDANVVLNALLGLVLVLVPAAEDTPSI
jgi:hypothetical protein